MCALSFLVCRSHNLCVHAHAHCLEGTLILTYNFGRSPLLKVITPIDLDVLGNCYRRKNLHLGVTETLCNGHLRNAAHL